MKAGSKYEPLYRHLRESGQDKLTIAFAEIEKLVGALPDSAYSSNAFWSNRSGGAQAAGWMEAGYHTTKVDLKRKRVTFQKPIRKYNATRVGGDVVWTGELIKMLRAHLGMNQEQFAHEIGLSQETISQLENDVYEPKRSVGKLLSFVAERSNFPYSTGE